MQDDGNSPKVTADDEKALFPDSPHHPDTDSPDQPLPPTPNTEIKQEIAAELNQAETAEQTAAAQATDPLPDDAVKISEPKEEEIKTTAGDVDAIHWTASEAVEHQRGALWYVVVSLVTAAIIGVTVWFKMWTTAGLALVVYVAILVIARRPTRTVNYTLTKAGLYIEDQLHPFAEFRAFGVRQEGPLWSIVLIPAKRFGLATTMYITEDQGESIVDAFGAVLPMENVKSDAVDKLTQRLKL
jgi:hypothetical protein